VSSTPKNICHLLIRIKIPRVSTQEQQDQFLGQFGKKCVSRFLTSTNNWQYGGYWVPAAAAYFDRQIKQLQKNGPHSFLSTMEVDTMGITNGCIDLLISTPEYPNYTRNNTYGIELYSETMYDSAMQNFTKPGGCRDLIQQCRALADIGDPDYVGNNNTVNEACELAQIDCYTNVIGDMNLLEVNIFYDFLRPRASTDKVTGTEKRLRYRGDTSRLLPNLHTGPVIS
jgi:hypothetical protein